MKKGKRERMYQEEKTIDEERKKRKDVLGRKENSIRKKRQQMKKGKRERMYQEEKTIDEERKKRKDVLGRKENR